MSNTNYFFNKKKSWSLFKDDILKWYLGPYIAKLLSTKKPLYIVDCFAGPGKFDDGMPGSPIIIANHIQSILNNKNTYNKNISGIFIEKCYYKELKSNLHNYNNCTVWEGSFEEHINEICKLAKSSNVFIYIDPYGIKSLNFEFIKRIYYSAKKENNSIEIFINFNSFGFIRQACNVLSYYSPFFISDIDDDTDDDISHEMLNKIYNSSKWVTLINDYKKDIYNAHQLEEKIVQEYQQTYNILFKYNLNIPIKTKEKNIPKYRMMFFSNHVDGILLMNRKMHDTLIKMHEKELNGQISLFDKPIGSAFEYTSNIKPLESCIKPIMEDNKKIYYKELACQIMKHTNIYYTEKDIQNELLELYTSNQIDIIRIDKKNNYIVSNTKSWDTKRYNIIIKSVL